MHVARGGQRVGSRGQERPIRRLIRVDLTHRGLLPADAALGRAVGDNRDVAQPQLQRRHRVLDMEHEGRAADDRRIDIGRRDAEIFAEVERRGARLRRGADQAVDILQSEAAIVEGAGDALRHQVDDVEAGTHLTEIGFRGADDRRAAALQLAHGAPPSAGTKTG